MIDLKCGFRWLAVLAYGKTFAIGLGMVILLLSSGNAHAQGLCTAPANNNVEQGWLDVTWTGPGCTGTGNSGQPVPGAGSDVVIPSGSTIRCGTTPTLNSLTVNAGGILNMGSGVAAGALVIKGDLTNNGTIQNRPSTTWVNSITVGGRWTNNGTFTPGTGAPQIDVILNGASGQTIGGTVATAFFNLTISGTGAKTLGANATVNGALTLTSGTLDVSTFALTANGAVTCGSTIADSSATGTFSYATGAQNVCAGNYGNLTFGSGAKTLATTGTIGIAGALNLGTATVTVGTSTVSFNGSGAQTVPALPYNNLTIAGSGTKTLAGSQAVAGTLSLTSGTLAVGTNTLTANGPVTCASGTFSSAAGGTVSYQTAGQTVCAGSYGNLTLSNVARTLQPSGTIAIAGTFAVGATAPTTTGSTVSFTGAAGQTIPAWIYNNLTIASTNTASLVGTTTVSGTFSLTSGTFSVNTRTLNLNSTVTCGGGALTSSATGVVNYAAAGAQTVCASLSYGVLNTSGSGTKTLAGNVRTAGAVTVASGTTLNQGSSTFTLRTGGVMTVNGGFTNTGTGTLTLGGNLVNNGTFLVDGSGGGCNTANAKAAIASSAGNRTWSGSGSFQLTDVTLSGQTSALAIRAFDATGGGGAMTSVADCTGAPVGPTAVRLASFTATVYGNRVLLRWQTAMETNNIGFRLYREAGDASSPVTSELISGSALMDGRRAAVSGGRSYTWWDDLPASVDPSKTRYFLADVDLRGEQTFHGPVATRPSNEAYPDVSNAPQLQRLAGSITGGSTAAPGQRGPAGRIAHGPSTPATQDAIAVQWALASGRALKVGISQTGWHQVTGKDLRDHGLEGADPAHLQLFADGRQIPVVTRGLARGRALAPESTVEFYATALDSQWSSERTYWLVAGASDGRRIGRVSSPGTVAAPASFPFTVTSAPKVIYFPALMNGDGDKYFGPLVSTDASAPTVLALEVRHADLAGKAALDVALQGVTDGAHLVAVLLNGKSMGQVELEGQALGTVHLQVDQAVTLVEGANQLGLVAEGGGMDLSLVASVGLTYGRRYVADGDVLSMTAPGGSRLLVNGFTSPRIRVMDVTDPETPCELAATVHSDGSSGYSLATNVAGTDSRTLLAFTDESIAPPTSLKANNPSSWHSADRAATLIVLTHAALGDALLPLVRLRQAQGYSVAVVDVEDVYDEFSFGNKTPQALRDFLALAASTWRKRPGFVLLAGAASADPRDFLGYGSVDLVPTKFVEATYNQTASDDWFVDFNEDGLPDLAIGRLPVRDPNEAAAVVQKLVGYSRTAGADWRKTAVLVSDTASEDFDFPAATAAVAAQIPTNIYLTQVFRGDFADDSLAHAAVVGAFNQGALLMSYMGHSSETAWHGNLLTMDDVPLLTNGSRLPLVSIMACWTGWFADPYGETLGEALLKAPQGGAIAVWASSGLTEPSGQQAMDEELMRLLFAPRKPTLGEAAARAKAATNDGDVRRTWILLGDPTLRLE